VLLAGAGGSGFIYARRPGEPEWRGIVMDPAFNDIIVLALVTSGERVLAGTNAGVYHGTADGASWTYSGVRDHYLLDATALAVQGARMHAGIRNGGTHILAHTDDHGDTWTVTEQQPGVLVGLRAHGARLWAARTDGLWWRAAAPTPV
jgi:hypothetical protein